MGGQNRLKCLMVLFVAFFGVCFALNSQNNLFAEISNKVTFEANEGMWPDDSVSQVFGVEYGQQVEKPAVPIREGYDFDGWVDVDGNDFDFGTGITGDITLIARWKVQSRVVTFDANGGVWSNGSVSEEVEVEYGQQVEELEEEPTREGYDFDGWVYKETGESFDFRTGITEDIVLIAQWKAKNVVPFGEDGTIDAHNESKCVTLTVKKYFEGDGGKWIRDTFKDYISADGKTFTKPTDVEGLKEYNAIFTNIFSTAVATGNDMRFEIGYKKSSDQYYTILSPSAITIKQNDVDLSNNCLIIVLSVLGYDENGAKYQFGFRESYVPIDYVCSNAAPDAA